MVRQINEQAGVKNRFSLLILVSLLLLVPLSSAITAKQSNWTPEPEATWINEVDFTATGVNTSLNFTQSAMLEIPTNHTVTSTQATISPMWDKIYPSESRFGHNQTLGWSGNLNNVEVSSNSNQLRLQANSSLNHNTDFETSTIVPGHGWIANGHDDEIWTIVGNNTTLSSNSGMLLPVNGHNNTSFLATSGLGDLTQNMHTCIRSPAINVPRIIQNYSLSFDQWLSLDTTDGVWVEYLDYQQNWNKISAPTSEGGINQNGLVHAPSTVWAGESGNWDRQTIELDNLISPNQNLVYFQFCLETSSITMNRGGLFIDNLVIFNEGDSLGAWFHGNLTGDYLPNSYSNFIIPLNFSQIPFVDEIEVNMNWDMQGYLYDYLTVEFSIDGGNSWTPISGNYGIPGTGVWYNGRLYYGETNGWIPMYMPLQYNFSSSQAINFTLLKFSAITNPYVNYGGTTSSGWEGVAIDSIVFHEKRGTQSANSLLFNDFNTQPNTGLYSTDGWLTTSSSTFNQWQWTDTMGLNSRETQTFDFNQGFNITAGWSVWSLDENGWEFGQASTTTMYGPQGFHSGSNGMGIALDGLYESEMLTHLYSPDYILPNGASARLSFRSWVCTEFNWDGGAVSVSTDGGVNWWFLPAKVPAFHDQISTINTNSPIYNEGIIDGSNVVGGCLNNPRGFDLKLYDVSNLSGNNVKFRYTFFSDQLVQYDGWYIDDAGVEVDVFETNGTWTSPQLQPDEVFGWGKLDGLITQSRETSVTFDILDSNGIVIPGYEQRQLPVDLEFDTVTHPTISVRANLQSNDSFLTPTIDTLAIGSGTFFNGFSLDNSELYQQISGTIDDLRTSNEGYIYSQNQTTLSMTIESNCPQTGAIVYLTGDNVSIQSQGLTMANHTVVSSELNIHRFSFEKFTYPDSMGDELLINFGSGSILENLVYQPICTISPKNTNLTITNDNASLINWPDHLTNSVQFTSLSVDSSEILPSSDGIIHASVADGQTIELNYQIIQSNQLSSQSTNGDLLMFKLNIDSAQPVSLLSQSSFIPDINSTQSQYHRVLSQDSCPNRSFDSDMVNPNVGLADCSITFTASGDFTISALELLATSTVDEIEVSVDNQVINDEIISQASLGVAQIPLVAITQYGSIQVDISSNSYLHLVDRIAPITHQRWLPEQQITIQTSHVRFDPITMSEADFSLDKVRLIISENDQYSGSVAAIEVSNLYSTPNYQVILGTEKITVDEQQSSVMCNDGYCAITWVIASTWALDDIDDIYWMVLATDSNGLQTGPSVTVRETPFNEIENDMEIVEFSAVDYRQNVVSDYTNSNWPYRLNGEQIITVQGKVRIEGLVNAYIDDGDSEIEITLAAVPPKNASGGQDEWLSEPVDWSQSWFVQTGPQGQFSLDITTPSDVQVPSNISLQITANIVRSGPIGELSTSQDMTSDNVQTRIIFDTSAPEVVSLSIYDPGGLIPADNHIWISGQDIPLKAIFSDIEGLGPEVTVWTWAEYADDTNQDGIMDSSEYRQSTVSVNYAAKYAEIDLPVISWQEVQGPYESARLSVVLTSKDLADNELIGGGDFGQDSDLATIIVENQYQTQLDSEDITFDLVNQQILPTHQHRFSYSVIDFNGIESLDSIELSLLGRNQESQCFIHYLPRDSEVVYDENCFTTTPVIQVTQFAGLQQWNIDTYFSLSWQAAMTYGSQGGIPSLKIYDEGQDLNLGVSSLTMFTWTPNNVILQNNSAIIDTESPFGFSNSTILWASADEFVQLSSNLNFQGTDIIVNSLSTDFSFTCIADDGADMSYISEVQFEGGQLTCSFKPEDITNLDEIEISMALYSSDESTQSTISRFVYTDEIEPVLTLLLNEILQLESNSLDNVLISASVLDNNMIVNPDLSLHWHILREGQIIPGSTNSTQIEFLSHSFETQGYVHQFEQYIDLTPYNFAIEESDQFVIWLELDDNSGQQLQGFATINQPLQPRLTWVVFEPKINTVELKSSKVINGEDLEIFTRLVNTGLSNGTVTVVLLDDTGLLLDTKDVFIEPGQWISTTWTVEAWTTGDISLTVVLVNYSESKTIVISDVEEFQSEDRQMFGTYGFIILLVVIIFGGFGYFYYTRSKELEQYTKLHLAQISLRKEEQRRNTQQFEDSSQEE